MDGHVAVGNSKLVRKIIPGELGSLHAGPCLALSILDAHRGCGRLHRRLRQKRNVILCLDAFCRSGIYVIEVALGAHHFAGPPRGFLQFNSITIGRIAAVWARLPLELQCIAALNGSPGALCNNSNAAKRHKSGWQRRWCNCNHLDDAGHFHRFNRVVGLQCSAVNGRARHYGIKHSVSRVSIP